MSFMATAVSVPDLDWPQTLRSMRILKSPYSLTRVSFHPFMLFMVNGFAFVLEGLVHGLARLLYVLEDSER